MHAVRRTEALLQQIDSLVEKHGQTNPDLLQDLQALRAELVASAARGPIDYALIALRISTWIKFVFDHLPPPH